MPPQHMHYHVPAQQGWIKDEVEELIEVGGLCHRSTVLLMLQYTFNCAFAQASMTPLLRWLWLCPDAVVV